jgi:cobalt/nickel transport system permease protein
MPAGHPTVHHRHLFIPGDSPVHRLAPDAKVAALFVFVISVALTPRHAVAAFVVDAFVLGTVFAVARLPVVVLARMVVIVPFVAFACFLPFIAGGDQVHVLGVDLSVAGMWATWNILAKAALGAFASILVAATTSIPDILHGLGRLRFPSVVVGIIGFMFRYLDVLADQLRRMRRAMTARGHDPRWLWQARPVASSVGVLFVRSYERGERIHGAMLARGFTGTMPTLDDRTSSPREWLTAGVPATIAFAAMILGFAAT